MVLTRIILTVFVLLALVACGRGKKESAQQPPAQTQTFAEQSRTADALFDEFFDNSVQVLSQPTTPAPTEVAPIRREPVRRETTTATVAPREVRFSPTGRFVVQVSTIASPTLANDIVRKLERQGFPAYSVTVQNPTTELLGTYYRVRIGGFETTNDARHFGETTLRPLGYDFWVDNKSNDGIGVGGAGLGTFFPQAVDYDARPTPTPTPTPAPVVPAPVVTPVAVVEIEDEPWGSIVPVETTPAQVVPAQVQDDNSWDNFEW